MKKNLDLINIKNIVLLNKTKKSPIDQSSLTLCNQTLLAAFTEEYENLTSKQDVTIGERLAYEMSVEHFFSNSLVHSPVQTSHNEYQMRKLDHCFMCLDLVKKDEYQYIIGTTGFKLVDKDMLPRDHFREYLSNQLYKLNNSAFDEGMMEGFDKLIACRKDNLKEIENLYKNKQKEHVLKYLHDNTIECSFVYIFLKKHSKLPDYVNEEFGITDNAKFKNDLLSTKLDLDSFSFHL